MRTRSRAAVVTLALLLAIACSHNPPNTTPQANVAHYGSEVVGAITQVQKVVIAANDSNVIRVEQAQPIMDDLRRALDMGGELSTALKQYDTATSPDSKAQLSQRILAVLSTISTALQSSTSSALPPQLVEQTSALVANVSTTIATIRSALALQGGAQ